MEIDATGWRVIDEPPVRFRRAAGMQPLAVPIPGGSIETLRAFLNVQSDQEFVLVVGESATFDFLGSSVRLNDQPGMIVEDWEAEIEEITTLETILDGEAGSAEPVYLEIKATEIGTLELWCVSRSDGRKWKLEFNVRNPNEAESL